MKRLTKHGIFASTVMFIGCCWYATAAARTVTKLTASLDYTTVVRGGVEAAPTSATGAGRFTLSVPDDGDPGGPTLSYVVEVDGLDLDGNQTPETGDNVTGMHLHDVTGTDDTGGTQHVLNIFGFPAVDDDDMTFDPVAGTVTGLWDDGDAAEHGAGGMGSTLELSTPGLIDKLLAGDVYLMVHTSGGSLPGGETIGGFLSVVPEPTTLTLAALLGGLLIGRRRRERGALC